MPRVLVIGFCSSTGYGSGKSTVADLLQRRLQSQGIHVERVSFAAPLKVICQKIVAKLTGKASPDKAEEITPGFTYRDLLVLVGGEAREQIEADVWVWPLKKVYQKHRYGTATQDVAIIVDDVRYQNEKDYIEAVGGLVINVMKQSPCGGVDAGDIDFSKIRYFKNYHTSGLGALDELSKRVGAMAELIVKHFFPPQETPEQAFEKFWRNL